MATPAWVSTTDTATTTWTTTHTITLGTFVAGDHLLLSFGTNGSGGNITAPSGWTEVVAIDLNWAQKWRVWIRQMTGAEASTVTVATSLTNRSAAQVIRCRTIRSGVVAGTTWDVASTSTTGYGVTVDPPSVTATWGATSNLAVAMLWGGSNTPTVTGYPSGYSNGDYVTAGVTVGSATKSTSSASDDPSAFTLSGSNNHRAVTVILRGAADTTAGAGNARATGTAHQPTITPPTVRATATAATGTGSAWPVRTPRVQVPSDLVIEWDLDNDGDYDQAVETITGYVQSGWLRRGRDYPSQVTGRSRPGQMQLILDNTGNRFNYFNASSPLNTPPFSTKTGRRIRVRTGDATLDDPVELARDRFATNGPLTTDDNGNSWSIPSGWLGFNVAGKRAEADGSPSASGQVFANTIDVNTTTYYAQAIMPYKDAVNRVGLLFHYTNANTYAYFYVGDGTGNIVQVSGGTHTVRATTGVENRDDMALGIAVNGTTVKAYVDGVEILSTTVTIATTELVGLYGRWYYQRAPLFSGFAVWDRQLRTQSWDTTPSGVLATMRVTKVVPSIDSLGNKIATLTAAGDLGLLDRPVEAPSSTGPDPDQSAGSKPGMMIGNVLHKVGALHPPGPIDGGDITLGSFGLDRQQAISIARAVESTELGFLYEPATGGIGFERRYGRAGSSVAGTFSDDPTVGGYAIERIVERDWQGDVINDVTSEISGRLATYDVITSNNAFTGFGVANDVTFNLPSASDGAAPGDLFIVAITKTVWTAGVRWITPPGWTALRDPGDEKGKMAVFARKATAADLGASTQFYDDTEPAGGSWAAIVFIVHNWLGSIASGVFATEAVGYGAAPAAALAQAQAGTVDLPTMFTPWGAKPTLFIGLRTGAHTTSAAAVVSSPSTDDMAPPGFDSMGSVHINPSGFGQEVLHTAIQWARRIRGQAVLSTTSFGGTFTGFSYTESMVIGVRGGFDEQDAPAVGGVQVHDENAADQADRNAVLAHPDPGRFFEDITAAREYNHLVLTRWGTDRPILSLGFTATRDRRHRDLALSLDLSQRYRVDADGRAGTGIDTYFFVETITHTFGQGTKMWAVDIDMSPATDAGSGADGYVAFTNADADTATATAGAHNPAITSSSSGITLVGTAETTYTGSNVTSINVPLPAISILAGDLIEITVATQESPTAAKPDTPSGYTERHDGGAVTAFIPRITGFSKKATGGESGSVTVSWPSGTPRPYASCKVWRGVHGTTPYDATATTATGSSNIDPASITTVTNNAVVVVSAAGNKTPATASTISSGFTSAIDQDAVVRGLVECYKLKATAGAENPAAYTWATDNSAAITYALRPA